MPTVSFPITIRISLELPDFLVPPQPPAAAEGAWQFTAAHEDASEPAPQRESIAELVASFRLPEPLVQTESEYMPAPVIVADSSFATAAAPAPQPHASPQPDAAPSEPNTADPTAAADDTQTGDTTLEGEEISPEQHNAIQLMLRSATIAKVAQAVGVHRNTVHRWKREDPRFRAVLNTHRNDVDEAARCKLEHLGCHAVNVLCTEVGSGNYRAAFQVAKGLGLLTGKPRERGYERADLVAQADAATALRAKADIAESQFACAPVAGQRKKPRAPDRGREEERQTAKIVRHRERLKTLDAIFKRLTAPETFSDADGI